MPSFVYTARDKHGVLQTGYLDAVDEDEVIGLLQNRGLFVTGLARKESAQARAVPRRITHRLHSRVSVDDRVLFCQQLAALVEAGVPLARSLEVVSWQAESRPFLLAIEQLRQDIEAGLTFHEALAKHPKVFSRFWVNLVETGEASGHLAQSLNQLARYLESVRGLQRKAVTALTYPLVLIGAAILALAVFVFKIIPIFSGIFASMNVELPLLTQLIVGMSNFARRYAILVFLGMVAVGWGVRKFVRTEQGRWIVDRLLLRLPLAKQFFAQFQLAQFARGLGTLLESGVPILFSLEIMEQSAVNKVYAQAIAQVKESVREGKPMAEPMERTGVFPPMTVQMVQVGEETGELGKMLDRVAKYYEERVATFIERLQVLFEPIAIVVMAVIIGTIVISMFLPIFSLAGGFRA